MNWFKGYAECYYCKNQDGPWILKDQKFICEDCWEKEKDKMYSKLNLDEFLARYNNDYDEIWFKSKGAEDFISYNELITHYDLSILWVYEFGLDQLDCLYIVFEEKI